MSGTVFALAPGADFAREFAAGLWERLGDDPWQLAQTQVLVNTRRSQRTIEVALAERIGAGPLPRVTVLADLYESPFVAADLPGAVDPVRRFLQMTRLVERFLLSRAEAGGPHAPVSAAPDLARALVTLMDELQEEGVDPAALDHVVSGIGAAAAQHWQQTLEFVDIARRLWPEILAQSGDVLDPKLRDRVVIAWRIADWAARPSDHPVIAAGSTGSVGSTADLMAAVARLPKGMVVLPGFDPAVEPDIWESVAADHPLGPFRGFLQRADLKPVDVVPWRETPGSARLRLLTQALRPAPVTDHWQGAIPAIGAELDEATRALTLIEAPTQRHEAEVIAVAIRQAIAVPEQTVALITPDARLARRVTAALETLDIVPDDSLGRPLADTPPGVLLRLIVEATAAPAAVTTAALLTHPLVQPGIERRAHLRLARRYVGTVLRQAPQRGALLPPWPEVETEEEAWLSALRDGLTPLADALPAGRLEDLIRLHRQAAEALTTPPEGTPRIWDKTDGGALSELVGQIEREAPAYDASPPAYPTLFASLIRGHEVRPEPGQVHPRVRILGTREARVAASDLTILGGLNEGVWPRLPDPDPWLSRPMRAQLGLPSPETAIGLSAHDFLQGASRPEVIVTRSRKIDGAPAVASRWLIRLEHLMGGIAGGEALDRAKERGRELLRVAESWHRPDVAIPRAPRPAPRPPLSARPRDLSATEVETLVRDAYAVYARRVLKLRPLDPLGRAPDYRERGTLLHRVLERLVSETRPYWPGPEEARTLLADIADRVLEEEVLQPDLRRIWRARVARFADWFIAGEEVRRREGTPAEPEIRGRMVLPLPGGPFKLIAKADRIDLLHNGGAAVFDYKTGTPPTEKQIKAGLSHQLHIQAAILGHGGFPGLGARPAHHGSYLGLTGGAEGGKETPVQDLADQVPVHMTRLEQLLSAYDMEETGYLARGRVERTDRAGDYDHLSRRAEWEAEDQE